MAPRYVFTNKHDGLRTKEHNLPVKPSARLVVPGYKDFTAYLWPTFGCSDWNKNFSAFAAHPHFCQQVVPDERRREISISQR